jgi:hypothetical protein
MEASGEPRAPHHFQNFPKCRKIHHLFSFLYPTLDLVIYNILKFYFCILFFFSFFYIIKSRSPEIEDRDDVEVGNWAKHKKTHFYS